MLLNSGNAPYRSDAVDVDVTCMWQVTYHYLSRPGEWLQPGPTEPKDRFKFRLVELDNLLLLTMDPTREYHEEELPGLQDEVHGLLGGEAEKASTCCRGR